MYCTTQSNEACLEDSQAAQPCQPRGTWKLVAGKRLLAARAFEYYFLMTTRNKKIEVEPGSTWSLGLHVDTDGSLLAMTRLESKTFSAKSRKAAEAWLARRGYRTDGTKF